MQLALASALFGFAFGTPDPVRGLASVRVGVSVGLGIVAQMQRPAIFTQLAPEVLFSVFPKHRWTLAHGLDGTSMLPCGG